MRKASRIAILLIVMHSIASAHADNEPLERPAVTIFTQPGCSECKKAIRFLELKGSRYKELDIAESQPNYRAFEALGGIGTPLTLYKDMRLHGYNQEVWNDIFDERKSE